MKQTKWISTVVILVIFMINWGYFIEMESVGATDNQSSANLIYLPIITKQKVLTITPTATNSPTITATVTPTATNSPTTTATVTPTATNSPTATATVTPTVTNTTTPSVLGSVLIENGACCVGGIAGEPLDIDAAFTATSPVGDVPEMRTVTGACATDEIMQQIPWEPFVSQKTFTIATVPINWSGFYVSAQYRDQVGNLSAIYCDDISVEGMPPLPTTVPSSTITPTVTNTATPSVLGSVLIENGACCVGGIAGEPLDIDAAFTATSPVGDVPEMRTVTGTCATDEIMQQIPWEPFASQKTFTIATVPINWSSFYVSAQYRDQVGNLSAIYCDDIAVEGMPPLPTTVPSSTITPTVTNR